MTTTPEPAMPPSDGGRSPHSSVAGTSDEVLGAYRRSIDNIDAAIIHMLAERFRITQRVGHLKAEHGLPPADPAREARQIERLRALAAWVEGWVARFDVPGSEVPPCWFLHTGLVEVLSAIADAERGAYAVVAAPSAAVEWHRQMREERTHLKELASRTGCTAVEHRATVRLGESVTDTDRFEQHLATLEEGRP